MDTVIAVKQTYIQTGIPLLYTILSDELILYIKTRKFDQHLPGNRIPGLHRILQGQYLKLENLIESIMELMYELGSTSTVSLCKVNFTDDGIECNHIYSSPRKMMLELRDDHKWACKELRKEILSYNTEYAHPGIEGLFKMLLVQHERTVWLLNGYRKKKQARLNL